MQEMIYCTKNILKKRIQKNEWCDYVIQPAGSSIRENNCMHKNSPMLDPRYFQVLFQVCFLVYGILFLDWKADWQHYGTTVFCCLFFNYAAESFKRKKWLPATGRQGWRAWGFSVLISALSLCLLLKTNYWFISALAAALTVLSKYFFRFRGRHFFNPSAFSIVATIMLTGKAWLSPGQWGTGTVLLFAVICFGFIVVTRVQKLDVSLAFILTFTGLLFWRQVIYLHWPVDFFVHSVTTGSLLLFTFFMISDPKTSPDHPAARIGWAVCIAFFSFYFTAFEWKNNTPVWMLVAAAPLVPLLNSLFKADAFRWSKTSIDLSSIHKLKLPIMRSLLKKTAASVILLALTTHASWAFCGFYVAKADGTLKNKTSQVILVRDGNKSVITMYNDFRGNFRDFAMVVPVPVVLKKSDIKVVDQSVFTILNEYSKPRLVEYYDQNPCMRYSLDEVSSNSLAGRAPGVALRGMSSKKYEEKVKIEAKYIVGEYDILILSAKESAGLEIWLEENGYKIPPGAEEVLEPYIKSNLKFFVVKVNEKELKKLNGRFLRPIQIRFSSPKFILPIRLGMANADGDQDMIVYAFTKKGRVEAVNYRTVNIPTGNNVPLFVKENFGNFYSNLFNNQWRKENRNIVFLEYAWDVSPKNYVKCDPCVSTAPALQDLLQAGVWWLTRDWNDYSDVLEEEETDYSDNVYFSRLHVRYNRRSFPQDLVFQVTPNKESFQARYVLHHPAGGDFSCEAGKKYLKDLKQRRKEEMNNLTVLTGKSYADWDELNSGEDAAFLPQEAAYASIAALPAEKKHNSTGGLLLASVTLAGLILLGSRIRKK